MLNVALAQEVLAFIEEHPESHRQASWSTAVRTREPLCDTTMCVGGTTIFLAQGPEALFDSMYGESEFPDVLAGQLLGLTTEESDKLFYTMSEVRALDGLRLLANDDLFGFRRMFGLELMQDDLDTNVGTCS